MIRRQFCRSSLLLSNGRFLASPSSSVVVAVASFPALCLLRTSSTTTNVGNRTSASRAHEKTERDSSSGFMYAVLASIALGLVAISQQDVIYGYFANYFAKYDAVFLMFRAAAGLGDKDPAMEIFALVKGLASSEEISALVNSRSPNGATPLIVACERGNVKAVHALLQIKEVDTRAKTYPDEQNGAGNKNAMHACMFLHPQRQAQEQHAIISMLAQHSPKLLTDTSADMTSPAHVAAYMGGHEALRTLIGAATALGRQQREHQYLVRQIVEAVDKGGNTPLHVAVAFTQKEVVKLLCEFRADTVAKNADGVTPAELTKDKDILALLKR